MKKVYTIIITMLLLANAAFSQTPVPNGELERWIYVTNPVNPGVDFWQPGSDPNDNWLASLNELAMVPATAGGPGPITAFRSDDKHSGEYAAKLVSAVMQLGPVAIFIPGMLGTAKMDMTGVRAFLGRPSNAKPTHLKGWYKYSPVNNDSCTAILLVSKWNAATLKRDTIGFGQVIIKDEVSAYTEFEVPVNYNYPSGQETPDSMTLLTIASAAFNIQNFMLCNGQVGSTMYVDDLTLGYPNGVTEHLMPEIFVTVYPNPAVESVTFEASKELKSGNVRIIGTNGSVIREVPMTGSKVSCDVSAFAPGMYHYRLMSGKEILNTGSFIVK